MSTLYLTNTLSLTMFPQKGHALIFQPITLDGARNLLRAEFTSGVDHAQTAAIASDLLGLPIKKQRIDIQLQPSDKLLVIQYRGPRLPEGATKLPPDTTLEFWQVHRLE